MRGAPRWWRWYWLGAALEVLAWLRGGSAWWLVVGGVMVVVGLRGLRSSSLLLLRAESEPAPRKVADPVRLDALVRAENAWRLANGQADNLLPYDDLPAETAAREAERALVRRLNDLGDAVRASGVSLRDVTVAQYSGALQAMGGVGGGGAVTLHVAEQRHPIGTVAVPPMPPMETWGQLAGTTARGEVIVHGEDPVWVAHSALTERSRIGLVHSEPYGPTWGHLSVIARCPGSGFWVRSSVSADRCTVMWEVSEPPA